VNGGVRGESALPRSSDVNLLGNGARHRLLSALCQALRELPQLGAIARIVGLRVSARVSEAVVAAAVTDWSSGSMVSRAVARTPSAMLLTGFATILVGM